VTLNWSDNSSNESGFEIQRQKRVGNSWTNTTTAGTTGANATQFTDSPGPGKFRYRVRAFNAAGSSAWTAWKQVNVN
jgi:serine protease